MPLEKVIEKTTIEFPGPLTLKQAKDLLKYISKKLPANVHYKEGQFGTFIAQDTEVLEDEGTAEITGAIIRLGDIIGSDAFQFEPSREDTSKLEKIRFSTIPGYDELTDYTPGVRQLWDEVRVLVEQYFSE